MTEQSKAIVLLSGGLDSAVVLALALKDEKQCITISYDYGQRHRLELRAAKSIAKHYKVPHHIIKVDHTVFGISALMSHQPIPQNPDLNSHEIPSTYVPARNTLFLAFAAAQAELNQADEIHVGPNKEDYHAYCDCRPEYYQAWEGVMRYATKRAVQGHPPKLYTPLIHMDKTEIVRKGMELGVPFDLTLSCYDPTPMGEHCDSCLACSLRNKAFEEAKSEELVGA